MKGQKLAAKGLAAKGQIKVQVEKPISKAQKGLKRVVKEEPLNEAQATGPSTKTTKKPAKALRVDRARIKKRAKQGVVALRCVAYPIRVGS